MPILGHCHWHKSDAREDQQGCRGRRERSPANPHIGYGLDSARGSTASFRKELRQ
jgi:hypothetical protein